MPLLGFTKLKDKLLDGSKTQTIRRPRKYPFKVGDKLYIYWKLRTKQCEKLGEAVITKIVRKRLLALTHEDAIKDGFPDRDHLLEALIRMHKIPLDRPFAFSNREFDVISFRWTLKFWNPTTVSEEEKQ